MAIAWFRPTSLPILRFGAKDQGYSTHRITSPYGNRDNPLNPGTTVFHDGLDIGNARQGDDVVAAADGFVVAEGVLGREWNSLASPSLGYYGNTYGGIMVVLQHANNTVSIYAHLRKTIINKGDKVSAGQKIGEIGDTGSAKGAAHLHFGIKVAGKTVNPEPLLKLTGELMAGPYNDIAGTTHEHAIIKTAEFGLWATVEGKKIEFNPDAPITRGEIASVMYRLLKETGAL